MKIGIEAQRIFRAGRHGMDVVALELIRRLQKLDEKNTYCIFAADGPHRDEIVPSAKLSIDVLKGFSYADWEQWSLPRAASRRAVDVLHCTANTAPLSCKPPLIITLHDIIYLEQRDLRGSAYQNAGSIYRKCVVPRAVAKAAAIITVSEFEREVIAARFPEAAPKLSVIYNGVDERFHQRYEPLEKKSFRSRYGLPENFILFLGNTAPKKNTDNVIKAYVRYCEMEGDCLPLVIADYERSRVERLLQKLQKPHLAGRFLCTGYVPASSMPLLYNCCSLFLYPSMRESFGLPILEAMACGVPVITSNTSAMPEIAAAAAVLTDPGDVDAIANDISRLLKDSALRKVYTEKGLSRASQFSWDNSARQLLRLYSDHQH